MEIKGVLFDLGGTLEDVWIDKNKAFSVIQHLLVSYDEAFDIDEELFHKIVEDGFKKYKEWNTLSCVELADRVIWADWIFPDFEQQKKLFVKLGSILTDIWESLYFKRYIKPNVKDVLRQLNCDGYKMGVISNTTSIRMPSLLMQMYGIDHFFECFLLSSAEGIRKPDPRIFQKASKQLGLEPEQCLYVGDQPSRDCRGPAMAGFGSNVLVGTSSAKEMEENKKYIGYVIEDISYLPEILKEIRKDNK